MLVSLVMLVVLVVIAVWVLTSVIGLAGSLVFNIIIWMLIGWLAGQLVKGGGYGPINNALLGLGGGIVGSFVYGLFIGDNKGDQNTITSIIVGVIGAIILIGIVRLFDKNFAKS